jgi:hypothetical protein
MTPDSGAWKEVPARRGRVMRIFGKLMVDGVLIRVLRRAGVYIHTMGASGKQ